jgi:hypothetical protein
MAMLNNQMVMYIDAKISVTMSFVDATLQHWCEPQQVT